MRTICPDTGPGSSLRIFSETGCVLVFVVAAAVKPLDKKIVVSRESCRPVFFKRLMHALEIGDESLRLAVARLVVGGAKKR